MAQTSPSIFALCHRLCSYQVHPQAPQLIPLSNFSLLGLMLARRSKLRPWLWAPGGSPGHSQLGWWHFLAPLQSYVNTLLFQVLSCQGTRF